MKAPSCSDDGLSVVDWSLVTLVDDSGVATECCSVNVTTCTAAVEMSTHRVILVWEINMYRRLDSVEGVDPPEEMSQWLGLSAEC